MQVGFKLHPSEFSNPRDHLDYLKAKLQVNVRYCKAGKFTPDNCKGLYYPLIHTINIYLDRHNSMEDIFMTEIHELAHATSKTNEFRYYYKTEDYKNSQEEMLARQIEYDFGIIYNIKYVVSPNHPLPFGGLVTERWKQYLNEAREVLEL